MLNKELTASRGIDMSKYVQSVNGVTPDDSGNVEVNATPPSISVGATTLAAGSTATVTKTGTDEAPVFTFGIPKGDKGDKGDTGATGPQGPQGPAGEASGSAYPTIRVPSFGSSTRAPSGGTWFCFGTAVIGIDDATWNYPVIAKEYSGGARLQYWTGDSVSTLGSCSTNSSIV